MTPEDAAELAILILRTLEAHGNDARAALASAIVADIEAGGFRVERSGDHIPIRRNPGEAGR